MLSWHPTTFSAKLSLDVDLLDWKLLFFNNCFHSVNICWCGEDCCPVSQQQAEISDSSSRGIHYDMLLWSLEMENACINSVNWSANKSNLVPHGNQTNSFLVQLLPSNKWITGGKNAILLEIHLIYLVYTVVKSWCVETSTRKVKFMIIERIFRNASNGNYSLVMKTDRHSQCTFTSRWVCGGWWNLSQQPYGKSRVCPE